jgi:hypothetical protein
MLAIDLCKHKWWRKYIIVPLYFILFMFKIMFNLNNHIFYVITESPNILITIIDMLDFKI